MAYVAVGATNVGSIQMHCDPELRTNVARQRGHELATQRLQEVARMGGGQGDDEGDEGDDEGKAANGAPGPRVTHVVRRWSKGEGVKGGEEMDVADVTEIAYAVRKGDPVGVFHLGSTIVAVFEAPRECTWGVQPGERVRVGQGILFAPDDAATAKRGRHARSSSAVQDDAA